MIPMRRTRASLVLGLGAVTVLACSHMAMAATTGTITGYVRGPGGVPIKNAIVTITDVGIKAVTDKNGYYSFTGVSVGTHTITTEIVTYKTASQDVNIIQDVTL